MLRFSIFLFVVTVATCTEITLSGNHSDYNIALNELKQAGVTWTTPSECNATSFPCNSSSNKMDIIMVKLLVWLQQSSNCSFHIRSIFQHSTSYFNFYKISISKANCIDSYITSKPLRISKLDHSKNYYDKDSITKTLIVYRDKTKYWSVEIIYKINPTKNLARYLNQMHR